MGAPFKGGGLLGAMGNQGITIKGLNTATGNVFVNCQLLTGRARDTVDPESELAKNIFYHAWIDPSGGFHYGMPAVRGGLNYHLYFHNKQER